MCIRLKVKSKSGESIQSHLLITDKKILVSYTYTFTYTHTQTHNWLLQLYRHSHRNLLSDVTLWCLPLLVSVFHFYSNTLVFSSRMVQRCSFRSENYPIHTQDAHCTNKPSLILTAQRFLPHLQTFAPHHNKKSSAAAAAWHRSLSAAAQGRNEVFSF